MSQNRLQNLPAIARQIGQIADEQDLTVYLVGGYVRDALLADTGASQASKDLDFTVVGDAVAFAQRLKGRLKGRNLVVYQRFGTAMMEADGYQLEFVTARRESYAADSRKPKVAVGDLQGDLARRDFTINAMAVGLNAGNRFQLCDPFAGQRDLESGLIRTPGDPEVTFDDDPLRILRAIRFAAQLGFAIDPAAREAINKMAARLEIVSFERITDELFRILGQEQPSVGFLLLDELGVLPFVFPELVDMKGVEQRKGYHHKDVFLHTLIVVDNVARVTDKLALRLAALLHDVAKPRTKRFDDSVGWTFHGHDEIGARMMGKIASRMRLSNELKAYVQKLIRLHLRPIFLSSEEVTDSAIRRLIVQAGSDIDDLLMLCRADITSGNPRRVAQHLRNFDFVMERVREVNEKDELRNFQSPVRGDKIMEICNIPPGPAVGVLKKAIEEAILDGLIPNEYEAALRYLMQVKDEYLPSNRARSAVPR